MKKIAQETIDEIREHVKDNPSSTYGQVAARYGVSEISVKRHCTDLGRGKNWRQGRKQTPSNHDKFWSAVDRTGNGCWEWQGRLNNSGYGFMYFDGKSQAAHRIAYTLAVGPITDGLELDHRCRNRICCNPGHLEPVTRAENMRRVHAVGQASVALQQPVPSDKPHFSSNVNATPALGQKTPRIESLHLYGSVEEWIRGEREYFAKVETEDRRWELSPDRLGTAWGRLTYFTIQGDGIGESVPSFSPKLAQEMFESVWGHGHSFVVRDNETKFVDAESARHALSIWRRRLEERYAAWESTETGRRFLAERAEEKYQKLRAEAEEREIDQILEEQENLRLAEVKRKASPKPYPKRIARECPGCCHCLPHQPKSKSWEDKHERREYHPDDFHDDESYMDEDVLDA
jgi:hypothetical protein